MREGHVELQGAKLWYQDAGGAGEPVLFLHAASGHAGFFGASQVSAFAAAGYRPVTYDRRGHGRTLCDAENVKAGTAADDLLALADSLRLGRFHLIGTAAGGIIALDFALSAGQRLLTLVVANSLGGAQDPDYLALSNSLRPPEFMHLPDDFKELGPEFRASQTARLQQWRELARTSFPGGKRAPSQAMKNRISFTALEGLNVPALFLTGDADLYSPPATVKLYADRIPGAAFISVPAVGHSLYWEQPETFNRAVLNFIVNRNNGNQSRA